MCVTKDSTNLMLFDSNSNRNGGDSNHIHGAQMQMPFMMILKKNHCNLRYAKEKGSTLIEMGKKRMNRCNDRHIDNVDPASIK